MSAKVKNSQRVSFTRCGHHVHTVYSPRPSRVGFYIGPTAISGFKNTSADQAKVLLEGKIDVLGGFVFFDGVGRGGRNVLEAGLESGRRLHVVFDTNFNVLDVKVLTAQPWSRVGDFLFGLVSFFFSLFLNYN